MVKMTLNFGLEQKCTSTRPIRKIRSRGNSGYFQLRHQTKQATLARNRNATSTSTHRGTLQRNSRLA